MLGFIIAFWATPTMTSGHLVFVTITTVWILISIQVKERDLIKFHAEDYQTYRNETGMLLPFPKQIAAVQTIIASLGSMPSSVPR